MAVGCSGSPADSSSNVEPTRTHAVFAIEQQLSSLTESQAEIAVMLGVLRVPVAINSDRLLRLMGMGHEMPPVGTCEVVDEAHATRTALSSYERVELLDVGDVTLSTSGKTRKLSRQAFPTITDFISGVLYTTREPASDFTVARSMALRTHGSSATPAFTFSVDAVAPPEQILLDGSSLGETTRLSIANTQDIKWTKGKKGDVAWVELGAVAGTKTISCAFDDSIGAGSIPNMLTSELGEGRITFHRVSIRPLNVANLDKVETRFDVHISQPVWLF